MEKGLNGVTIAPAPAKTARDRTCNVSESTVAMLMDTERIVRVVESRHTR
jgi:hypothetical protein